MLPGTHGHCGLLPARSRRFAACDVRHVQTQREASPPASFASRPSEPRWSEPGGPQRDDQTCQITTHPAGHSGLLPLRPYSSPFTSADTSRRGGERGSPAGVVLPVPRNPAGANREGLSVTIRRVRRPPPRRPCFRFPLIKWRNVVPRLSQFTSRPTPLPMACSSGHHCPVRTSLAEKHNPPELRQGEGHAPATRNVPRQENKRWRADPP